jgi:hypothetical protein
MRGKKAFYQFGGNDPVQFILFDIGWIHRLNARGGEFRIEQAAADQRRRPSEAGAVFAA